MRRGDLSKCDIKVLNIVITDWQNCIIIFSSTKIRHEQGCFGETAFSPNLPTVHVCVYDVGCFVDVLASQSRYSGRKPSVPMIAILFSSSVGLSIE